jgi:hypothetical protein
MRCKVPIPLLGFEAGRVIHSPWYGAGEVPRLLSVGSAELDGPAMGPGAGPLNPAPARPISPAACTSPYIGAGGKRQQRLIGGWAQPRVRTQDEIGRVAARIEA